MKILSRIFFLLCLPTLIWNAPLCSSPSDSPASYKEPATLSVWDLLSYDNLSYDNIMTFIQGIEYGNPSDYFSKWKIEDILNFVTFLARQGVSDSDDQGKEELEQDIQWLFSDDSQDLQGGSWWSFSNFDKKNISIIPAIYSHSNTKPDIILCKGWVAKKCQKVKKFIKKHKKAIIIGTVVVVAVAVVAVAVVAASSAGAAAAATGAAGAAASAGSSSSSKNSKSNESESSENSPSIPNATMQITPHDSSILKSALEHQISSFKENIAKEAFFDPFNPNGQGEGLPWEETGRVIGPLFAHESFNNLNSQLSAYPQFSREVENIKGHSEIDRKFSADYAPLFSNSGKETDFNALAYQMRGEKALTLGFYNQATQDLGKAIELSPKDPLPYLQRSTSYFNMGQYDHSLKDFHAFAEQASQESNIHPLDASEFSLGFAKGLPKGAYESGKGIFLFLGDFVKHPIHTSTQIFDALSTLANLAHNDEWGVIGEVLSPEIYQLVMDWDTLPSDKKGELSGFALAKHGTDFLLPGAVAKIASKSVKSAKELAAVCRNLKIARETLILETAAGLGDGAKIAEIIETGQKTAFLGKELGFTSREMGQLKQAGKLETTLQNKFNHLSLLKQESIKLFENAESYLKSHRGFKPEFEVRELIHKTGIPTFSRPKGIPKEYRVKLSTNGAGIKYVHPGSDQTYVRVMPGKSHNKYPHQQKPYVVQMKDGETLDKFGKAVPRNSPEAHIPLEEFIYIGE